ncbi:MAG TPA: DUF503 domain-containing protein [Thermoanaerobaculia bacterium]
MPVGIVSCELHLPGSRSLKDKRRVVKSLIERLHQRYRVSIAETGFHDLHQRAEITLALVTSGAAEMEKGMDDMRGVVESEVELFLTRWDQQLLEEEER